MLRFEIDGRERIARTRGDARLPTAVFVHPFMLNSMFWWDQLEGLSDIRRCIAPDLPGFGRSEPIRLDRIDVAEYADDLLRCLDCWQVEEPVDLVGLSGSALACAIAAARAPQRIRSLTLMSAPFITSMGAAYDRYKTEMARIAVVEDKGIVVRRMLDYVVGPGLGLIEQARYRSMFEETRYEMLVAFLTAATVELPEDLAARLRMPVLLPAGECDTLISPEQTRQQADTLPDGRVEILAGCGRFPPIERPEEFNTALRRFWEATA